MLYAVLTSLGVVAAFVAIAAGFVAFVSGARAVGYRGSQLLSGDVKALQRPGAETTAEGAESHSATHAEIDACRCSCGVGRRRARSPEELVAGPVQLSGLLRMVGIVPNAPIGQKRA